jgi:choline kinase
MGSSRDMKAIVLCAGTGGRLRPLTEDRPKCLLAFGTRTVLDCCLDHLAAVGIGEAIIVVGYHRELVERLYRDRRDPAVRFIVNDDYGVTNTAFSLRLALDGLDSDFVLINGDVLFDRGILADLIAHPSANCAAVDGEIALDHEEIKIIASNGRIERISKELDPRRSLGEAIGLYKVGRSTIPALKAVYEDLERKGECRHYFEKGFERICEEAGDGAGAFGLAFTQGRPWVEIDTLEDFAHAQREIYPRICG